ncbi:MAG: response regulator transcription factor [Anaerolineales bacterium]
MIRIVAMDDHPLMLAALKDAISTQADMQLVGTADHGANLIDLVREERPDVITMDLGISTGGFDPIACARELKKEFPNIPVLVLTNYAKRVWVRLLVEAGVSGYLLKSDADDRSVVQAIRTLAAGGRYFSPQIAGELIDQKEQTELMPLEMSILRLMAEGASIKKTANSLSLSPKRIRNMRMTIYDKLEVDRDGGVSLAFAAVQKARKIGLLPDNDMDANLIELLSRAEEEDEKEDDERA